MYKKMTSRMIVAVFVLLLFISVSSAIAGEKGSFSVGHGALLSVVDDPKSRNVGALTAKYGFNLPGALTPYIGTGLGYSIPRDGNRGEAGTGFKTGLAGQAGVNYQLGGNVSLNIDYKYIKMSPEAAQGGNEPAAQKVGVGFDIKF